MAITDKEAARQIIDDLPDDATWKDIHYALYVRAKIERGLADEEAGNLIPHEDMKREIAAWRESVGQKLLAESSGTLSNT